MNTRRTLITFALLAIVGCTRPYYRRQADMDAYCLTDQKALLAGSDPQTFRIAIDPQSRMYDPANPDIEPMPPDDPTSNRYMQCVDCKAGSKCWRCLPKTPFTENPSWLEYLPRDGRGTVVIDMQDAVLLALRHSPEYQSELEELYLSALDVSFERFRFDTQFFGGSEVLLIADARGRSEAGNSSTEFIVSPLGRTNSGPSRLGGTRFTARRLTATGGELVVGAANSLMWQFAGPDEQTTTTLLDFSLIQPLLRAGGRSQVLERLTISERTLLANVRQMERYRRGYYLNITTGRDEGQGPSRRGGFFGGSGLEGFAGVGGGGFGNVGNFGFFGGFGGGGQQFGVGGGFTGGAGAQGAGGYIGLLQNQQTIRNQRANVAALRDSYEQLAASYDAGRIDRFQVDLARQALYNAQSQLLLAEAGYESTLDNFKIELGLPPELPLEIEDPFLDRFNLLDAQLEAVEERVNQTLAGLRELRQRLQDEAALLDPNDPAFVQRFQRLLNQAVTLEAAVEERVAAVRADLQTLDEALPERRRYLERLAGREEVADAQIDERLFSVEALDGRIAQRKAEFATLQTQLDSVWARLEALQQAAPADVANPLPETIDALADLSGLLLELSLVQAAARLDAISFEPVELTDEQALLIASAYRRDWQNARASLVDSWRLIYFNANALMSDLDLVFSGDIGNVGDNPLNIRETTGRLRVGLQWDAPLARVAERNIYRQSLIEYQQARRTYYQFRDRVSQSLRSTLRQTRLNEINFELRRAAVLVAISQVDLTQLRLSQPPQPAAPGGVVETTFSATTARDLVQSLSDLLNVQNDFLSVWVNYEVQRLALDHDLGIMQLDEAGLRQEHDVPLSAYVAGALEIREKLCNATDLYPGLSNPGISQGEPIEPLPLEFPESVDPEGVEPLPAPLENPAGDVEPTVHLASAAETAETNRVIPAYAELPVAASHVETLPLAFPSAAGEGAGQP